MGKREGYLSWDDYFMSVALLSGKRSKDPSTQVGACIVNKNNIIESIGYNGLPKGCSDDEFPWDKEGETLKTKYPFVVHAELNAILNSKAYYIIIPSGNIINFSLSLALKPRSTILCILP